jgi:quercetin dioxygenase-like cupin family protein
MSDRREFMQTLLASALASGAAQTDATSRATAPSQAARSSRTIHRQPLSGQFEGLDAYFAEVTIPPGIASRPHRHSGFVLGYVIEGELSFGINGEPPRVVRAGEVFYEPPGATHSTGASARSDQPVKFLAIVIGPQGAEVTTYER